MWKYYAVLSAVFAALTAVLAKAGVRGVDSNLATAVRTGVILCLTWGIVWAGGGVGKIATLSGRNWLFLILSGVATGVSWLCYFKALQGGPVSKVAPIDKMSVVLTIVFGLIFFGEALDWKVAVGGALILAGSLVLIL